MTVSCIIRFNTIKIYVNEVLHLSFFKTKKVTIESWIEGAGHYIIEINTGDVLLLCEYDSPEKWKAVLEALDLAIP